MPEDPEPNHSSHVVPRQAGEITGHHSPWLILVSLFVVVVVGVFVWPTVWRYDHVNHSGSVLPVRIHRVTGRTEILYGQNGWVEVKQKEGPASPPASPQASPPASKALPPDALAKLDGRLEITSYGYLNVDIYNGTDRKLGDVRIRLVLRNSDKSEALNREYIISSTTYSGGDPLKSSRYTVDCGCRQQKGQHPEWAIVGATWH